MESLFWLICSPWHPKSPTLSPPPPSLPFLLSLAQLMQASLHGGAHYAQKKHGTLCKDMHAPSNSSLPIVRVQQHTVIRSVSSLCFRLPHHLHTHSHTTHKYPLSHTCRRVLGRATKTNAQQPLSRMAIYPPTKTRPSSCGSIPPPLPNIRFFFPLGPWHQLVQGIVACPYMRTANRRPSFLLDSNCAVAFLACGTCLKTLGDTHKSHELSPLSLFCKRSNPETCDAYGNGNFFPLSLLHGVECGVCKYRCGASDDAAGVCSTKVKNCAQQTYKASSLGSLHNISNF
jgi:hypothetical protein